MPSKKDLYRQSALDRLSSPDQLEQLMQVISLKGWIALSGLCIVLAGAIAWGIFGSIPNNISGQGLLIKSGGIEKVSTLGAGQITKVNVEASSFVEENEIVAEIDKSSINIPGRPILCILVHTLNLNSIIVALNSVKNYTLPAGFDVYIEMFEELNG